MDRSIPVHLQRYSYEIVKKGDGSRYAARVHIKK